MDSRLLSRTITEWPCKQLPVTVVLIALFLSPLSRCNPIQPLTRCSEEEVLIKNQPFKDNLINSCYPSFTTSSSTEEQLQKFRNLTLNNVLTNIQQQRIVAETIINQTKENFCSSSDYANLSNTPTTESLQILKQEEALIKIYSSLLEHSSNIYFIEEHFKQADNCDRRDSNTVEKTKQLVANILGIACDLRNVIKSMNSDTDFVQVMNNVIDSSLINHSCCSKKISHACQTVRSSYRLLQTVYNYVEGHFQLYST